MVLPARLMQMNLLYAGGADLAHPYLSPLFGDVSGFPPTLLQAGTRDLFLSNAVRMHRKLRDAPACARSCTCGKACPTPASAAPPPRITRSAPNSRPSSPRFRGRQAGSIARARSATLST